MTKAIIGLYRHDERTKTSRLVERIELGEDFAALTRRKTWKAEVTKAVADRGFEVVSIGLVHSGADLDVNIVVSIAQRPPAFGERRKPVTRGGRPVEGPVKTGKTMAAKRRAAKEAPRR
jgi:hypothetical protein